MEYRKLSYGFKHELLTLDEFRSGYLLDTDCQPIGQRLDTEVVGKKEGIIGSILDGQDIGMITIGESPKNKLYKYESIDGGHRKRYIKGYMENKFPVRGKYFSQLSDEDKKLFKNYQMVLCIYGPLSVFEKGFVFRNMNLTTDVNHQEHRNSFGDIDIANLIRFQVRNVVGINNIPHQLFESSGKHFRYLGFNNNRLRQEQYVTYFTYRLLQDEKVGSGSQSELTKFYENDFTKEQIDKLKSELDELLSFLLNCSVAFKKKSTTGLSQRYFKVLSFLWFHMMDNCKKFKVKNNDYQNLMKLFQEADLRVQRKEELIDLDFDEGRTIGQAYMNYPGGYTDKSDDKVKQTLIWLLEELDIDDIFIELDNKRSYTKQEKINKLIDQDYKCYITGQDVDYKDCEAAHITAYDNGGKSTYDNFVMVLKKHNRDMGTMNLHDYMETLKK